MNKFPVLNFVDFIAVEDETLTTTSQHVAAVFGKRHDNVLREIRSLTEQLPEDFRLLNFEETVELRANPSRGAAIPTTSYTLTRDGFSLLAMRFTGKKALAFQVAYIAAFNAMAKYIKNQREGLQYQYFRKELEFKNKKDSVSCAAKEMRNWQDEKPKLESDMEKILDTMQPSLLVN